MQLQCHTIDRINIKRQTIYVNCHPFMERRNSTHFSIRSVETFMTFIHKITRLLGHDNRMHFSIELKPPMQQQHSHVCTKKRLLRDSERDHPKHIFHSHHHCSTRNFDRRFRKRSTEHTNTRMNFVCSQTDTILKRMGGGKDRVMRRYERQKGFVCLPP